MITLSKFCEDVDHNVLSYINSTTSRPLLNSKKQWMRSNINPMIPEIARYYIRGAEKNPILEPACLFRSSGSFEV